LRVTRRRQEAQDLAGLSVTFDRRDGAYGDLGPFQATSRQPAPDGVPERWFVQAAVGDDVDDHARQVVAALRSVGSLRGRAGR
jgi:hypothetical protein